MSETPRRGSQSGPRVDADRVVADLRELARRTGDDAGAQRLCWTDRWLEARAFLRELLAEIGIEPEQDEAGNLWAYLPAKTRDTPVSGSDPDTGGAAFRGGVVAVGSHLDSVPDGGWLDGALGVMAGVGVLRAFATEVERPPLALVDWADEEGARFGRSLFGSAAFAGRLDPDAVADLTDSQGLRLQDVLAEHDVELSRMGDCARRREGLAAYLELHIEQGPVMEADGVIVAAVKGCQGIERIRFTFKGQAAHAGTTPMAMRRDAGLAAAQTALEAERIATEHGGVATTGELRLSPGISTAVPSEAALSCDLRHHDAPTLNTMLNAAVDAAARIAAERGCALRQTDVFRIDPTLFDENLVSHAAAAAEAQTGRASELTSGALHDAAEVARVMPAAMMFVPSRGGISHAPQEDTMEGDLKNGIEAFGDLVWRVVNP